MQKYSSFTKSITYPFTYKNIYSLVFSLVKKVTTSNITYEKNSQKEIKCIFMTIFISKENKCYIVKVRGLNDNFYINKRTNVTFHPFIYVKSSFNGC